MACCFSNLAVGFAGLVLLSIPARATPIAPCNASFTICAIPEDILLQLPFTAIAGDAVHVEPRSAEGSDAFRIFKPYLYRMSNVCTMQPKEFKVINTGAGTVLDNLAAYTQWRRKKPHTLSYYDLKLAWFDAEVVRLLQHCFGQRDQRDSFCSSPH